MTDAPEQRTADWYDWRRKGLGASDAPIIMGVSPWKTPHQLWELKTGRAEPDKGNWATQRGNDLEPKARARLELKTGKEFPPILAEHPEMRFLRASLDGWNNDEKIAAEIKCPGRADHEKAVAGEVPEKYWPQLQHQLLVTGATSVYYYSYYDGGDKESPPSDALVIVTADREYQKKLFAELLAFWKLVQTDTEPPLTDRDYVLLRDVKLKAKFEEWHDAKLKADHWANVELRVKAEILTHEDVAGRRVRCGDFRVGKVHRKGNVDYAAVPALKGVDLDPYRKAPSSYQTIAREKKEGEGP